MTAPDALIPDSLGDADLRLLPRREIEQRDEIIRHLRGNLPFCAHDADFSAAAVEGTHGKRNRGAVLVLQIHHLMIHNIVVTAEYAPAVIRLRDGAFNVGIGRMMFFGRGFHKGGKGAVTVDLQRAVRAILFHRASLRAELRRTGRHILSPEIGKPAKALQPRASLTKQPLHNVQIVTALCQNHRCAVLRAVPVPAHIAVALVDVSDALHVNDVDDPPHAPVLHQPLQQPEERSKAENVADHYPHAAPPGGIRNLQALRRRRCNRLFQEQLISQLNGAHCGSKMQPVLRGNDCGICKFRAVKDLLPARKAGIRRQCKHSPDVIPALRIRIGNPDQFEFRTILCAEFRVGCPPISGTNQDYFDFFHDKLLFSFRMTLFYCTICTGKSKCCFCSQIFFFRSSS